MPLKPLSGLIRLQVTGPDRPGPAGKWATSESESVAGPNSSCPTWNRPTSNKPRRGPPAGCRPSPSLSCPQAVRVRRAWQPATLILQAARPGDSDRDWQVSESPRPAALARLSRPGEVCRPPTLRLGG